MKWMPLVYVTSIGTIIVLHTLPWRPQTPWSMVCVTLLSLGALLLAHWQDTPEEDRDGKGGG